MIRAVFDTNVLISALIFPGSIPSEILKAAIKKRYQLYTSHFILSEFRKVLK